VSVNEQQIEQWNGVESNHWVEYAERYDGQLAPFADVLFERLALVGADRVLDVGCGCGVTTLTAAAQALHAVGLDLSGPMLAVARNRAADAGLANVEFIQADAQVHWFVPASFDVVVSRFGVMFFDDLTPAFANLRAALADDGRLAFVCWRPLDANEWLFVPGAAAAAHVALPDLGGDNAPGMFSLADDDAVRALLGAAGFNAIDVEPFDTTITLGGGGTVDETLDYLLGTGIAHALLDNAAPDARERAIDAVRASLAERYEAGVGVRLGAGAWVVSARA
jgi:SAM-dependent methyltransferase